MQSQSQILDEDRPCNVCFSKLAEFGNEMIFCDGCDVCVHQACYGVSNIPDGDWFCDRCAAKAKDEPCVLCPVYEGAMKRTEQGYWCHCSCVWWIPEVHFKDPIAMRPVMGVPAVDKKRFSLRCMFCDTKNGACIQCSHKSCKNSFHVTCAFATKESPDGATFLMYEIADGLPLVRKAFCPKHREQQAIERAKVKEQITTTNSQSSRPKATNPVTSPRKSPASSPRASAVDKHPYKPLTQPLKSKISSRADSSQSRTPHSTRNESPATEQRAKLPKAASLSASLPVQQSRLGTLPANERPAVNGIRETERHSPKRARTSVNNEVHAQETQFLKEYKHASVDTQDHPCTSLLPPLMRWTNESHTSSLFHASALSRNSIFSSVEGSFE